MLLKNGFFKNKKALYDGFSTGKFVLQLLKLIYMGNFQKVDVTLNKVLTTSTEAFNTMTIFHGELVLIPDMIANIEAAQTEIGK